MKYLLILFLLTSCDNNHDFNISNYKSKVDDYCKPCGGVNSAFFNIYGQEITCKDGTHLTQQWKEIPIFLMIGTCK